VKIRKQERIENVVTWSSFVLAVVIAMGIFFAKVESPVDEYGGIIGLVLVLVLLGLLSSALGITAGWQVYGWFIPIYRPSNTDGLSALRDYLNWGGSIRRLPRGDAWDLYHWIRQKQEEYQAGDLPVALQHRLENIDGWVWDFDQLWEWRDEDEEAMGLLARYIAATATADVPLHWIEMPPCWEMEGNLDAGFALGRWARRVRGRFWADELPPGVVMRLESLVAWHWGWGEFEYGFHHLEKYVAREGTALVPNGHVEQNTNLWCSKGHEEHHFHLGDWVDSQRRSYWRHDVTYQTPNGLDLVERLESLRGWVWRLIN